MRLGAHNAPNGEETHNLFWALEQIPPMLAYIEEDPTWQAVVGMRTFLRTLYSKISVVARPALGPHALPAWHRQIQHHPVCPVPAAAPQPATGVLYPVRVAGVGTVPPPNGHLGGEYAVPG